MTDGNEDFPAGPGLDTLAGPIADAPRAVLRVDAAGRVLEASPAAVALLEQGGAALTGRDFFRDLVPGTDVPRGRGRFLAGLRRGGVDLRGRFALDRASGPVRFDLRAVSEASGTGALIDLSSPERAFGPGVGDAVVLRRKRAQAVDVSACELEPIHVPGSIQPDAVLLVAEPAGLTVLACSANVAEAFPGAGPALLGRPILGHALDGLLPEAFVADLRGAQVEDRLGDGRTVSGTVRLDGEGGSAFRAVAHAQGGHILVELEGLPDRPGDFGPADPLGAGPAMSRLRAAGSVAEAAAATAREVRAITGFETVLVYRFDPDWNGEAIAEDRVPDWSRSLLGLHFPASDIPAQARALYVRSRSRFVTDRDAEPVPILGDARLAGDPIDLTFAQHRSLSPIHLEYQRNLGVNGSMSASIIVDGTLWGLLIGHHRRPHYVPPEARASAALLAEALAMRVQEIEGRRL
jgi:chemotaxis family two-component system sensor kinase Cph1